jgi:hypothetical protein
MIGTRRGMSLSNGSRAALAAATLAVGLGACGGSSGSASSGPSSTSAPTTATSTSSAPAPSATTKATPGAKLAVGQSARVDYRPAGASGPAKDATLLVTVKSVEKGTLDDFKGVQLDATQKASSPAYVKVRVTNLGPHPVDIDGTAAAIQGVDNTGNTQQSVTFIGDFPRCPDQASTTPIPAGHGYDDCLTFLVPGGITKVAYTGTDSYISSPVTWSSN